MPFRRWCKPEKLQYARENRRNPTEAERTLWKELRGKKIGVRIHRQAIILGYIVDFYCPQARLIIECDGYQHDKERDAIRDHHLEEKGFAILQFNNEDVISKTKNVLQNILSLVPHPSPLSI